MENLAEEYLEQGWTTYGLVELKRLEDEGHEGVERLDSLTKVLMKGNKAQLEEAQKMLLAWLRRRDSSTHPLARKLRLRRAFILKKLRQYDSAINEVRQLLDSEPTSATLTCLLGNLYGWTNTTDGWKTSLTYFDKAVALEDQWWEPRFERLDKMFLLGAGDPDYWNQIVERTNDWIQNQVVMTERERLIVWTYSAVAAVLINPKHIDTDHYAKQRIEAQKIVIPTDQLEEWHIEDIYKRAVKVRFPSDDDRTIRTELWKFLGETHSKLVPHEPWLEE